MTLQLLDNLWARRIKRTINASEFHNLGRYTNPYIIVQITSNLAEPTWEKAGYIGQKVSFQGFIALASQQEIKLNLLSVLFFPILTTQGYYELQYYAPKRLGQVDFTLWEYRGEIQNTIIEDVQKAENLNVDLSSLETKLDNLQQTMCKKEDDLEINSTHTISNNLSYLPQLSYFPGVF